MHRELVADGQAPIVPGIYHDLAVQHLRRYFHVLAEAFAHLSVREPLSHGEVHARIGSGENFLFRDLLRELIMRVAIRL